MVLSGALKDNSVIERLLLHDNPLGEVGAWHLMAAITANKNLEYIGLQGANFLSTCESCPTQVSCHCSFSHGFLLYSPGLCLCMVMLSTCNMVT